MCAMTPFFNNLSAGVGSMSDSGNKCVMAFIGRALCALGQGARLSGSTRKSVNRLPTVVPGAYAPGPLWWAICRNHRNSACKSVYLPTGWEAHHTSKRSVQPKIPWPVENVMPRPFGRYDANTGTPSCESSTTGLHQASSVHHCSHCT